MSTPRVLANRIVSRVTDRVGVRFNILRATLLSRGIKGQFNDVKSYCMFIGYPRSGHSLVGSLLDAHANAVIAHELDALRYLAAGGLTRDGLYYLILSRDRAFTATGRSWTGYDYAVPHQSQGTFQRLLVVGDKRGGDSTRRLRERPELLQLLKTTVAVDVRLVHVVRNPFDNIATMHRRSGRRLDAVVDAYFDMCDTNGAIREREAGSVFDLRHEALIADPRAQLSQLLDFLALTTHSDYLEDCASVVFDSPSRSRESIDWPSEVVAEIERRIGRHDFLAGYSFSD